jgi:hypothetical protein
MDEDIFLMDNIEDIDTKEIKELDILNKIANGDKNPQLDKPKEVIFMKEIHEGIPYVLKFKNGLLHFEPIK